MNTYIWSFLKCVSECDLRKRLFSPSPRESLSTSDSPSSATSSFSSSSELPFASSPAAAADWSSASHNSRVELNISCIGSSSAFIVHRTHTPPPLPLVLRGAIPVAPILEHFVRVLVVFFSVLVQVHFVRAATRRCARYSRLGRCADAAVHLSARSRGGAADQPYRRSGRRPVRADRPPLAHLYPGRALFAHESIRRRPVHPLEMEI